MFLKMIMIARKVSSKRIARIWRRESKARFQKKKKQQQQQQQQQQQANNTLNAFILNT